MSDDSEQLVTRTDHDGLAVLTLNRPERLNALNAALFRQLDSHVTDLSSATATVGCVVLRGSGRCFSAGHDLDDIAKGESNFELQYQGHVVERLASLPQPLIAAVHGHCYTGALELALAADLIVASHNAKFADTHAQWGLTPIWGLSQRLPRRVGPSRALFMMFTCGVYTGEEAERMGLANLSVADDDFDRSVEQLARSILANSWFSHVANKRLVKASDQVPLWAGLAHEAYHNEGVAPDFEARMARWQR